jgi:hypothetical protein
MFETEEIVKGTVFLEFVSTKDFKFVLEAVFTDPALIGTYRAHVAMDLDQWEKLNKDNKERHIEIWKQDLARHINDLIDSPPVESRFNGYELPQVTQSVKPPLKKNTKSWFFG